MSEILNWATLDNSDSIRLYPDNRGEYVQIGSEFGTKYSLMTSGVMEEESIFESWRVQGLKNYNLTTGEYKMAKVGFYGYKSGRIDDFTIYFADAAAYTKTTNLVIGLCARNAVTIKAHATEVESLSDSTNYVKTFKIISSHDPIYPEDDFMKDPKNGIIIMFPKDSNISISQFGVGKTSNDTSFLNYTQLTNLVCLDRRSVFDAGTHLYKGDNDGSDVAIKYSSKIFTNYITDHTKNNFDNYHINKENIVGLNSLKYYAPLLKSKNDSDIENLVFSRCYISHESLSLSDNIKINNKRIEALQIPIDSGEAWKAGHRIQFTSYISKNNFQIYIALTTVEPDVTSSEWIPADYTVAPKEVNGEEIVWEVTFNKNMIYYTGNTGIWIRVDNIDKVGPNYTHLQQICCRTYRNVQNNSKDLMYLHAKANTNDNTAPFEVTPDVRVIFDFDGRAQFMEMLYRKISALR